MFTHNSILIYDIETDSLDVDTAKVKWFGAYSYLDKEYYLIPFDKNDKDIKELIKRHKVIVGFNNKGFDNVILLNNLKDEEMFKYKVILDLLEISAPKGGQYGQFHKNRLAQMGFKLKSFSLKNIIEVLKLDTEGSKGNINYKIFQKDNWTKEEIIQIKIYLKQDIDLTKKLLEWYEEQFAPLKKYLPQKQQDNLLYLKSSLSVLAYNIICNKAGLPVEFGEKIEVQSYSGGHHLEQRWNIVKGNIIEIDFTSAYPHAIMMGNLHSIAKEDEDGWTGDGYYNLQGKYNNKEQGKIELALKDLFLERLKAKKTGDKAKNLSYKIIINSHYGTSGNPIFKSIYNHDTASDCTLIVRTWLKKLAQTLEVNGFICLYGFTDSIFVLVPEGLNKNQLLFYVNKFLKDSTSHMPFPMDTFKMEIEEEIKMIWFVKKNCYLFVTHDNEVKYKSTLLNTNTPRAVIKIFDEYIKPIIIKTLDVKFTREELETQMKTLLQQQTELAAQEYKVTELSTYKVQTSLQYQISDKYGTGRHFLIPNNKSIGIGLSKSTKKKKGVRYCTIDEFKQHGLTVEDIELKHLMSHLKPFYSLTEKNNVIDEHIKRETEKLGLKPEDSILFNDSKQTVLF